MTWFVQIIVRSLYGSARRCFMSGFIHIFICADSDGMNDNDRVKCTQTRQGWGWSWWGLGSWGCGPHTPTRSHHVHLLTWLHASVPTWERKRGAPGRIPWAVLSPAAAMNCVRFPATPMGRESNPEGVLKTWVGEVSNPRIETRLYIMVLKLL